MKRFKKKTLALILASAVTVVGAFGAEFYKNTINAIDFGNKRDGIINMSIHTTNPYEKPLSFTQKDDNTYVLILPETNSQIIDMPKLNDEIYDVEISTLPYTTEKKGYTKIVLSVDTNAQLTASTQIYIPKTSNPIYLEKNEENENFYSYQFSYSPEEVVEEENNSTAQNNISNNVTTPPLAQTTKSNTQNVSKIPAKKVKALSTKDILTFIAGLLVVLGLSAIIYKQSKAKIREIVGENNIINVDEDDDDNKKTINKKTKQNQIKKINNTINTLDKQFTQTSRLPLSEIKKINTQDADSLNVKSQTITVEDEHNIIDMDKLFQETKSIHTSVTSEDEENEALEDFLSAYTFDDEIINEDIQQEIIEEPLYNEELFEKYINNEKLEFSKDDIDKINSLLSVEINNETLKHLEKYAVSNPIKKVPTKQERLENIVTTYAIKQDITFSSEDISILNKLLCVEIDNDFLTNLKTNPETIKEIQASYQENKTHAYKKTDIITLNVKDMLPNLSEALKKQGNKKIESNYKPDVVYYKDGYEVSTLTLDDMMPNLSLELNNKNAYKTRPSDAIQYSESGYNVATMKIEGLPDLGDALKNPEKYQSVEKKPIEINEKDLLNSLNNVEFKPFYEGFENFEIVDDSEENNDSEVYSVPSINDVQKEFDEFENLTIINEEYFEVPSVEIKNDNDEELEKLINENLEHKIGSNNENIEDKSKHSQDAKELLQLIEEQQNNRKNNLRAKETQIKQNVTESVNKEEKITQEEFCIIDGIKYNILDKVMITENISCILANSKAGFYVLGHVDEKMFTIKHYEKLKAQKIQARVSDKINHLITRYIVKVGLHKFIINVTKDSMEYVMDLC